MGKADVGLHGRAKGAEPGQAAARCIDPEGGAGNRETLEKSGEEGFGEADEYRDS